MEKTLSQRMAAHAETHSDSRELLLEAIPKVRLAERLQEIGRHMPRVLSFRPSEEAGHQ